MKPFIVRMPSVQTQSPEVFLFPGILTDKYYFMQCVTKEYDFEKNEGMPSTPLVYESRNRKYMNVTSITATLKVARKTFPNRT